MSKDELIISGMESRFQLNKKVVLSGMEFIIVGTSLHHGEVYVELKPLNFVPLFFFNFTCPARFLDL